MNPLDKSLDRLLRAAAAARTEPIPETEPLPSGWEERILAEWRRSGKEADLTEVLRILRRGLVLACLIMTVSLLFSLARHSHDAGDEWTYARMSVNIALNQ
jgi:hypothetical protein